MTRRTLIKSGLIGTGAIVLPVAQFARVAGSDESDPHIASPPVERFAQPLPIPPTIAPTRSEGSQTARSPAAPRRCGGLAAGAIIVVVGLITAAGAVGAGHSHGHAQPSPVSAAGS